MPSRERAGSIEYLCHDHAQKGVRLYFIFTISIFLVPLPRTFWNGLQWPTYFRHDAYSRPYQYDVGWRSIFCGLPGLSVWRESLWTIYYKLYSIKYKYRVVAILYPSLVFVYLLTIYSSLSPSVQLELCALIWTSAHCITEPLIHSITVLLTSSMLRYCRNVRPTWVKFNSKDTKESEWCLRFWVLSPIRGLR